MPRDRVRAARRTRGRRGARGTGPRGVTPVLRAPGARSARDRQHQHPLLPWLHPPRDGAHQRHQRLARPDRHRPRARAGRDRTRRSGVDAVARPQPVAVGGPRAATGRHRVDGADGRGRSGRDAGPGDRARTAGRPVRVGRHARPRGARQDHPLPRPGRGGRHRTGRRAAPRLGPVELHPPGRRRRPRGARRRRRS